MEDLLLVRLRDDEPVGVLQEDRPELPGLAERLETDPVPREKLLAGVLWKVLRIDPALRGRLLGERFADVFWQALRVRRMCGQRRESLEVHDELVGCALRPQEGLLLRRKRVERGVVLYDREVLGVVAKALVGVVLYPLGIPAGLDQRRIRPGAGPDEKLRFSSRSDRLPLDRDQGRAPRPSSFAAPTPSPE